MRRAARIARWTLLAVLLLLVAFLAFVPVGRYLARAAWEEGGILARRRPIAALATSPGTDPHTRAKLQLVLAARAFAVDSVKLDARQSFTTYTALRSDTLVLVVSAAYRDRLKFHTWWFPIVGSVPYKGYFRPEDALAEARDLRQRGYDTLVRPAAAFSTLGWFNDPLLSSTLELDSVSLANTVIHELTHNTFYASGQAIFNESFANFVGSHGATWFFRTLGDSALVRESEADWARERLMGAFWARTYDALDSAFTAHPDSRAARLAARDTVFARARERFAHDVAPLLPGYRPGATLALHLDNATLMSRRIYRTGLDLFDGVLAREGNRLPEAVQRIIALAKSKPDAPYAALRAWLTSVPAEPAAQ
ncbi:MAG TPA: aminopeptidase [Gemmatimonadaceae bacterium]|jgi:predicted aminopeptidase|nr:aminopeptidase [Gemmatimonadaceae bacterium]